MSIDDSAARRLPRWRLDDPVPWPAREARKLLESLEWHARQHPEADAAHEQHLSEDAAQAWTEAGLASQVPSRFLHALRTGGELRYPVRIHGIRVCIIVDQISELPHDLQREVVVWEAMQEVVDIVDTSPPEPCDGFTLHEAMPREIALAYWERDGSTIYASRPGVNSSGTLRKTRGRLGGNFAACLPFAALMAMGERVTGLFTAPFSQAAAGAVAAAGLLAGVAVPTMPETHPPTLAVVDFADASASARADAIQRLPLAAAAPARSARQKPSKAARSSRNDQDEPATASAGPTAHPASPEPTQTLAPSAEPPLQPSHPAPPLPVTQNTATARRTSAGLDQVASAKPLAETLHDHLGGLIGDLTTGAAGTHRSEAG